MMIITWQCIAPISRGLRSPEAKCSVEEDLRGEQRPVRCLCGHYQQNCTLEWKGRRFTGLNLILTHDLTFKFVPILLVLSTSSMLLLDQRTLQIKYRVPASEIYRMSLSPFIDDVAVFHVKAVSQSRIELSLKVVLMLLKYR